MANEQTLTARSTDIKPKGRHGVASAMSPKIGRSREI
jgi:hypothetical protein